MNPVTVFVLSILAVLSLACLIETLTLARRGVL